MMTLRTIHPSITTPLTPMNQKDLEERINSFLMDNMNDLFYSNLISKAQRYKKENKIKFITIDIGVYWHQRREFSKAYEWFMIGAALDVVQCMDNLIIILANGIGCNSNIKEAVAWLNKIREISISSFYPSAEQLMVAKASDWQQPDQFVWKTIVAKDYFVMKCFNRESTLRNEYTSFLGTQLSKLSAKMKSSIGKELAEFSPELAGFFYFLLWNSYTFNTSEAKNTKNLSDYYYKLAAQKKIINVHMLEYFLPISKTDKKELTSLAQADNLIALSILSDEIANVEINKLILLQLKIVVGILSDKALSEYSQFSPTEKKEVLHLLKSKAKLIMTQLKADNKNNAFVLWADITIKGQYLEEVVQAAASYQASADQILFSILETVHSELIMNPVTLYNSIFNKPPAPAIEEKLNPVTPVVDLLIARNLKTFITQELYGLEEKEIALYPLQMRLILKNTLTSHKFIEQNSNFLYKVYKCVLSLDSYAQYYKDNIEKGSLIFLYEGPSQVITRLMEPEKSDDINFISFLLLALTKGAEPNLKTLEFCFLQMLKVNIVPADNFIMLASLRSFYKKVKALNNESLCEKYIAAINHFDNEKLYLSENKVLHNSIHLSESKTPITTPLPENLAPVTNTSSSSLPIPSTANATLSSDLPTINEASPLPDQQASSTSSELPSTDTHNVTSIVIDPSEPSDALPVVCNVDRLSPPPCNPDHPDFQEYSAITPHISYYPTLSPQHYSEVGSCQNSLADDQKTPVTFTTSIDYETLSPPSILVGMPLLNYVKKILMTEETTALSVFNQMYQNATSLEVKDFLYHYLIYCAFTKEMLPAFAYLTAIAGEDDNAKLIHFFTTQLLSITVASGATNVDQAEIKDSTKYNELLPSLFTATLSTMNNPSESRKSLPYHQLLSFGFGKNNLFALHGISHYAAENNNTALALLVSEQVQNCLQNKPR